MRYALGLTALVSMCLLPACDSWSDVMECEEFEPVDLTIDFVGFDDHVGQELFLRATSSLNIQPPNPDRFEEVFRTSLVIPTGDFYFHQPGSLISCVSHHVDFFIDVNDNGVYDAPPTDHAWRLYTFVDSDIEVVFTFTVDPNHCRYTRGGNPRSCMYGDIEWPMP